MKKIPLLLVLFLSSFMFAQNISLEPFATGFSQPVDLKNAGDDRLFVVEQAGRIQIVNPDGTTNANPFLDISSQVTSGGERGLLSVAFHPDYATNGFFYVNYTFTESSDLFTKIARYSVDPADPNIALPGSELELLRYEQPFSNHNGGFITFGPDGFLYISSGDGGSGGDPGNRAQNTELLLGKLLRIDVDSPVGGVNYGIPPSNPFAGNPSNAQEIWAYGLRNPWKFSFDSITDDLWIADVGQNAIEEINKVGVDEAGLNYGWVCFEGSQPYTPLPPLANCPPPSAGLTGPVAEYPHSQGSSITGGYVYNGTLQPSLQGYYFFADFVSGLIGTVDNTNVLNNLGTFGGNWSTFGVDQNDELFIVNYSGSISRVAESPIAGLDENDASTFSMYPNPASNNVTIALKNSLLSGYTILDLKGSVLFSKEKMATANKEIDISTLSQGIYLLKVTTQNNTTLIKKLVVE